MLCSCIVTELKSTFDSLACEFTAKTGEGGIVSRCGCNIFTIGNRFTRSSFCFSASSVRKSFAFVPLKLLHAECEASLCFIRSPSYVLFSITKFYCFSHCGRCFTDPGWRLDIKIQLQCGHKLL